MQTDDFQIEFRDRPELPNRRRHAYGEPVFQNLTVGFTATLSGGKYPIISCAYDTLIEHDILAWL